MLLALFAGGSVLAQQRPTAISAKLPINVRPVGDSAKPWVFWYWMQGSYSKPAIKADLIAMKDAGLAGAYLAPIKGKQDPPLFEPAIDQLSPAWWDMVRYAVQQADSLGLKIAMLPNDGFATAGGPWISPELSMQKVVSASTRVKGGKLIDIDLATPEAYKGYYKDITLLAFPANTGIHQNSYDLKPKVSTSTGVDASFLTVRGNKQNFSSSEPAWVQFEFKEPFTCRSLVTHVNSFNYQAQRLTVEVSDDGRTFRKAEQLNPPRAGWLDWDFDNTYSLVPVKAKYFRFKYDREGSEPGAEDLDAAKWKQSLKIAGIELSSEPRINVFEAKNGETWRIGKRTTVQQLPDSLCVPMSRILDLSAQLKGNHLKWKAPAGEWIILRIGHTSTGHMNETAGAGKGLESDKFNPEAVKLQFDKWFGEAMRTVGPDLAPRVLNTFHVDSWECGSQNWSPVFQEEFKKRRGYDLLKYMPAMVGVPVGSADISERFLFDVRQTIAELINDNFYKTLKALCEKHKLIFTAEATAPVMVGDGLLHFANVDVPMGEFWLRSPSHDKPNDMADAISGAHIYGKPVVMSESFTEIRMNWLEHPANLKTLQDRNYALGINRFVYHVFTHNPWFDRKPGMTLNDIGLLFQRDQTWWKPGYAWVEYARRCQEMLQQGIPVTDLAVFTGEETPRRAILPDRLVSSLPGIFGPARVLAERERLRNAGSPSREMPDKVQISANLSLPESWVDPMNGYAYDSFNKDALIRLAKVEDGYIVLPGGARYAMLVLPGEHQMQPSADLMSLAVVEKLYTLINDGATVVLGVRPRTTPGLTNYRAEDLKFHELVEKIWGGDYADRRQGNDVIKMKTLGKGRVILGPYTASSFNMLGLEKDILFNGQKGNMAWNHRKSDKDDIYFISNQDSARKVLNISFRVKGKRAQIYDPVSGEIWDQQVSENQDRSLLDLTFEPNASYFIIFHEGTLGAEKSRTQLVDVQRIEGAWDVKFDATLGGPEQVQHFSDLQDWTANVDSAIRYYSGTAKYMKNVKMSSYKKGQRYWLDIGEVNNIASVKVNGIDCGVAWTAPYRVEITNALKKGTNTLEIEVTNTWANRILGDLRLPEDKRVVKTTATIRIQGKPLAKAGLIGPLTVMKEK